MTEEEIKAIETRCNAAMQQLSAFGGWRNEFEKFARPVVAQDIPTLIAELRKAWEEIEIMSRERKELDESWAELERRVASPEYVAFQKASDLNKLPKATSHDRALAKQPEEVG